ncbi:DUF5683 domain-containing protein [Spongiivirga citrea]|uniref:DUF5683 domain-containing protein n=1 Tax=Spongiivirga citrea TaxID=1481457 RepID=UPI0019537A43|nr:DUF5683 domain-containing protein [Spongiivirga citrea]
MVKVDTVKAKFKKARRVNLDPNAPAKAAFYSAVLPGLGQAYNSKYWKIPIVYGALGTSMYLYINNNNEYNRFRDEFKRRLDLGLDGPPETGEFSNLTNQALIEAQELFQRNRDLALLISVGLYALNIIDANVDAHLQQYNVNEQLTFTPKIFQDPLNFSTSVTLSITYNF